VVRGGYAIFHDSSWNQGAQGLWQNPPYYAESDAFAFGGNNCTFATAACATRYGLTPSAISMSAGFPTFTAPPNPADFTGTILAQDTNFKQGRIQQFNVNVEQELPGQVVLTAGYAGSRAVPTFWNSAITSTWDLRPPAARSPGYTWDAVRTDRHSAYVSRVRVFHHRQHL
jgi:hypothetical protein